MTAPAYIIDLSRCTGCQTCVIACKDRANLPDAVDWLRVESHEGGLYPTPALTYRVMHCFHCAKPTCIPACPVDAIAKQVDDLVQINASICTGCEKCVSACPFLAITMLPEGIATKCDGCADEMAQGWDPTCVRACPTRALKYEPIADILPTHRVLDAAFDDHNIAPAVVFLRWSGET